MRPYHSLLATFVLIFTGLFAGTACADDSQPGYLELKETTANRYGVIWRNPKLTNQQLRLSLQFPAGVKNLTSPVLRELPGATVERRLIETDAQGLIGMEQAGAGLWHRIDGGVLVCPADQWVLT